MLKLGEVGVFRITMDAKCEERVVFRAELLTLMPIILQHMILRTPLGKNLLALMTGRQLP
jgi:hypothetical protein